MGSGKSTNVGGTEKKLRRRKPFWQVMDALYEKSIANEQDNRTVSEIAS